MVSDERTIDAHLKAVADATRRGILGLLRKRQLSVLEIAEEFPMSRPAISKHLRILKEAGLVVETPAGRQRLYALESAPFGAISAWFAGFNGARRAAPSGAVASRSSAVAGRGPVRPGSHPDMGDWRVW